MKNRFGSRRRGRQLRYGVVVFAWLLSQHALAQLDDTFGVSPPMPFSSAPFTIQIHAYTGTSPSPGLVPSRTTVSGTTIRIEGCVPNVGFSTPSDYWVDAVVGPLPAGTYSVEYYSSHFCIPNTADPPRLYFVDQVVVADAPALATYIVTDLGPFSATGINASAQVVGNTLNDSPNFHAVLYSAGSLIDLGALANGPTFATAINDNGQVVGSRGTGLGTFLYSGGVLTDLPVCGAFNSHPTGISGDGRVVGYCENPDPPYTRHAFLYQAGATSDLGVGDRYSEANGINASGQVVGEMAADGLQPKRAFRYGAGVLTDLGTASGSDSYAYAVNASGQIVGASGGRAVLYGAGTISDLGTVADYSNLPYQYRARSINAGGQVIGDASYYAALDAFFIRPWVRIDGTMRDPNTLVDPITGWNITEVVGITDAGQIAANGCGPPGCHALLLSPISSLNYEGLWWNAPASSESGWGINFAQQSDVIVATWFTYDLTGKGWWLAMTAPSTGTHTFSGALYQTRGPAFDAVPFDPNQVTRTPVGVGTITFTDVSNGTFAYTVNGVSQTKTIARQVFGALPDCTFSPLNNLVTATNYQDLWWNSPAGSESGWGINLTHQGDTIFGTWFTYDQDGSPMWLAVTAKKGPAGVYSGDLMRTTGPAFNAVPFDPAAVQRTKVGDATLGFVDGNRGFFAYTVNGTQQTKVITREMFRAPGTPCR